MTKKIDAIVQARLGSTRLPKKVLLEINEEPLINVVVSKLRESKYIDRIIVATTTEASDQELVDYCAQKKILCYRGEKDNVLLRFIGACERFHCDKIIRVCSDNPFIDIASMNKQLALFIEDDSIDYCTYTTYDGTPIILKPIGLFVEAVTFKALKRITELASVPKYFEHVTMFIYEHPELFNIKKIPLDKSVNADYRFTIDYPDDIKFCEEIMKTSTDYSIKSILELMGKNKVLSEQNLQFSLANKKIYK